MTALAFSLGIAVLFALIVAWEGGPQERALVLRPAGLLTWFFSGNWPAKVGAVLLIIGTGALLRYLMLHIDLPASTKLLAGVVIATGLGVASGTLRAYPARRALHLALGGASLGVAYLTAYSAHGFFRLVGEFEALGALFVVACVATAFSIASRAMSVAVLAMVGAFIAPAFALQHPGPAPVYGYYALASLLVLLMVWQRGWRPLIHLSFLFTLAGGLFFGWTQKFYSPAFYSQMQPLLLLSVAIHLAMPLAEAPDSAAKVRVSTWQRRFDLGYFLLLPLTALALTLAIAPNAPRGSALGLLALGMLWFVAAGAQQVRFHQGVGRYVAVGLAFAMMSGLLWVDNLPYFLIGAVIACALLASGPKLGVPAQVDTLLSTVALAFAGGYLLQTVATAVVGTPFLNRPFAHHVILALALGAAGLRMRSRNSRLAPVFVALTCAWLLLVSAREAIRLDLEYLSQVCYLVLLLAGAAYAASSRWRAPHVAVVAIFAVVLFAVGMISAPGFEPWAMLPLMLAAHLVFAVLAGLVDRHSNESASGVAHVALGVVPLMLLPLALAFNANLTEPRVQVVMTLLVCSAVAASVQAMVMRNKGAAWRNPFSTLAFIAFSAWLFYQTIFHIEREAWAIAYEVIALGYLLQISKSVAASGDYGARLFTSVGAVATMSVLVAMLLRLFGPPGVLTILDITRVFLPAVLSLCLATVGGLIAWWSRRRQSRKLWVTGATLLAAAALKLVLLDFGSLGELGNILATMAAGGIFFLVAWLVPIPPKAATIRLPEPASRPPPAAAPAREAAPAHARESPRDAVAAKDYPNTRPLEQQSDVDAKAAMPPASVGKSAPVAEPSPRRSSRAAPQVKEPSRTYGWLWISGGLVLVALIYNYQSQRTVKRISQPAAEQSTRPAPIQEGRAFIVPNKVEAPAPSQAADAPVRQTPAQVVDVCSRFADRMPSDYLVLASGAYRGRPLGYLAEPSRHEMTAFDVYVDEPDRDIVLALGAYEPAIWNVRSTRATRIVGVIVSGYHQGVVAGLGSDVPVLQAAHDDHAPCGYFYIDGGRAQAADALVRSLLARAVSTVYVANNGRVSIGRGNAPDSAFMSPDPTSLDRYRPPGAALIGTSGIEALLQDGKLRQASAGELDVWLSRSRAATGSAPSKLSSGIARSNHLKIYTVLKPLELPMRLSGLYVFIVPSGLPVPSGGPNLTILSNDPPSCSGMLCDRL
jgi:hypothetical protein